VPGGCPGTSCDMLSLKIAIQVSEVTETPTSQSCHSPQWRSWSKSAHTLTLFGCSSLSWHVPRWPDAQEAAKATALVQFNRPNPEGTDGIDLKHRCREVGYFHRERIKLPGAVPVHGVLRTWRALSVAQSLEKTSRTTARTEWWLGPRAFLKGLLTGSVLIVS